MYVQEEYVLQGEFLQIGSILWACSMLISGAKMSNVFSGDYWIHTKLFVKDMGAPCAWIQHQ